MVVRHPLAAAVTAIAEDLETCNAAACTDSTATDIRGFIAANETPDTDLAPFRSLLDAYSSDATEPYLNTGFFILRGGPFAELWRDETRRQPLYLPYEQNAFNALAASPGHQVMVLDPAVWNVHGALLDAVSLDGPAKILHTTSTGGQHTLSQAGVPLGGGALQGNLKIFARPELMQVQSAHLSRFVKTHQEDLPQCLT